ncbi:hypothetical protein RB195_025504 [Necator americanus]|uniref:MIF4G domain-containing protein n=1 Tax=Necator americanus TaxID=51031 RepID=A0ABR1ESM0_NECAM
MEALGEAIREQLSSVLNSLDPNSDIKALVHNCILDQCGLLQKREESRDDVDNTEEEPRFQEEMKQRLQEEEAETFRLFTEEMAFKQRLKNVALVIGTNGGWFVDEEEETSQTVSSSVYRSRVRYVQQKHGRKLSECSSSRKRTSAVSKAQH